MKNIKTIFLSGLLILSACSLPDEYHIWHYAKYWFNTMDMQNGTMTHMFDARYGNYYGNRPVLMPFYEEDSLRFVQVRNDEPLFIVNEQGMVLQELARSAGGVDNLALADDGRFLLYKSGKNLFMVHPDGSGQKQLTFDVYDDFAPAISSDGSRIACLRADTTASSQKRLVVIDTTATTEQTLCVMSSYYSPKPAFHPDQQRIFYYLHSKDPAVASGLYSIRLDGSDKKMWFSGSFYSSNIAFDEDGNVVFSFLRHMYVLHNADGSITDLGELLENSYNTVHISVFGKRIVFASGHDHGRILSIYTDGSGLRALANGDEPYLFDEGRKMVFLGAKWFQEKE